MSIYRSRVVGIPNMRLRGYKYLTLVKNYLLVIYLHFENVLWTAIAIEKPQEFFDNLSNTYMYVRKIVRACVFIKNV